MTISIYLAAQFSRRHELMAYAADLKAAGFDVTSRWLAVDNDAIDSKLMTAQETQDAIPGYALMDLEDIGRADFLVAFSEHPDTPTKRGGRHVEFGMAYAWKKRCVVVGRQENIFHHLPGVECFASWPEALQGLAAIAHG